MALTTVKCPSCGASITNVDTKIDQFYCMYCGSLIVNHNNKRLTIDINQTNHSTIDVNQTYRKIDEARIREAEINRELKLKEIEKEQAANKSDKFWLIKMIGSFALIIFSLYAAYSIYCKVQASKGKIAVDVFPYDLVGENYLSVQSALKAAGFTNFELIDRQDEKDNNIVTSISIGGNNSWGHTPYYFYPDDLVVITFH